jgi:surface polysaccharide O-acyltransferase-like enzyme
MKIRNNNLDIVKTISCIGIVIMHCDYPKNILNYVKVINRFGVPFFFFVSGYYFLKNNDIKLRRIILKIVHIFNLLFYSGIFYFIFFILFNNFLYHNNWNVGDYTRKILTKGKLMKFFITNDPFIFSHLWFLLALLYCYFLLFILKILNKYIIINNIYLILSFLFGEIFYIILAEFSGLKIFITTYKISNSDKYIYLPNLFLFRSFPFITLGIFLRINNIKIKVTSQKYFFIFIIGTILSCIEYYFIQKSLITYISTFIQIFPLIGFSLSNNQFNNNIMLSYIGRELIYFRIFHCY